jgi:hypothetical protein
MDRDPIQHQPRILGADGPCRADHGSRRTSGSRHGADGTGLEVASAPLPATSASTAAKSGASSKKPPDLLIPTGRSRQEPATSPGQTGAQPGTCPVGKFRDHLAQFNRYKTDLTPETDPPRSWGLWLPGRMQSHVVGERRDYWGGFATLLSKVKDVFREAIAGAVLTTGHGTRGRLHGAPWVGDRPT